MSIYLTHTRPPAIEAPTVEAPPVYFGPSSLVVNRTERGKEFMSSLWVGGKGLSEDGRWGKLFAFTFEMGPNGTTPPEFVAETLMRPYRSQLAALYGNDPADIILMAIPKIIAGKIYDRPLLVDEMLETLL